MVAREPAHLARLVKACPRPGCGSSNVKWRYYNNKKSSQPRYLCLGCNELFTFGGNVRLPKEEKLRQAQAAAAAAGVEVKKKARMKTAPAQSSSSTGRNVQKERPPMMESRPKRKIRNLKDESVVRPASPISKTKKTMGRLRLRLISGTVIDLRRTSSDEESEADAGPAEMSSPGVMHQGEFEGMSGLELPEVELVDDVSLGSGADVREYGQLEAVEGCGPALSWTSSEQLGAPIARCIGSSEPELLDWEKESLLIDTGLSSLRSWEDVYA